MTDLVKIAPDIRTLVFQSAAFFASLYESFQALTSIQVSHFVEWFSGKDLDSIWTKRDVVGAGTLIMLDEIDGGFKITCAATSNGQSRIDFNNKRHYKHDECVFICVAKDFKTSSGGGMNAGMAGDTGSTAPINSAQFIGDLGSDKLNVRTKDATTSNEVDTGETYDTNWHSFKIECGSANIKYYVDGVITNTITSNRPTAKMQINFGCNTNGSAMSMGMRYVEAFNTSISILSSLYERLSALTQVKGQRVVETFSGSVLSERWNMSNGGSNAMADSVNGGLVLTTGTAHNDNTILNFNGKRQYDPTNAIIIAVIEALSAADSQVAIGFNNSTTGFTDASTIVGIKGVTNWGLETGENGGSVSKTDGSIAYNTTEHLMKLVLSSADGKSYIDGVLDVTKTTDRPNQKQQPWFKVNNRSVGSTRTGAIKYFEAYNKLTTETDFPSVYELFNALTTLAKIHFWEWFDGNDLHNRWTKQDVTGVGTFAMDDSIDGGFKITCADQNSGASVMHFNNKRQFDETSCEVIIVSKGVFVGAAGSARIGFSGTTGTNPVNSAYWGSQAGGSVFDCVTKDGSTQSATNASISFDEVFHTWKVVCGSADIKFYADGVLDVTKTTNRPTAKMQPFIQINTGSGINNADTINIRYYEAKNT